MSADFIGVEGGAQCPGMMNFPDLAPILSDHPATFAGQLRPAVAAYLARFHRLLA